MKNLLVFSYYYPPQKGIGGKRMYRLLSRLPAYGWRPIVLTTPWPPADDRDLEQPLYAPGLVIDRGYTPEWFWNLYHPPTRGSESNPGGLAKALNTMSRLLGYPIDGKVWLAPLAYRRAKEISRAEKIDAVLSSSAPYSSHLAALALAKDLGAPFYADLRDPWTFNFLWRNRPPLQKRLDSFAERFVLEGAQQTFFAARSTEQKYRLLYPELAERFHTVYSGFEADAGPVAPWPLERPRLAVAHFGRFYGVRRTTHMLSSIAALIREASLTPQDLHLLTLGEMQSADQQQLRESGLLGYFPVSPMMPYEKGLSVLRGADVLFLCDYDTEPYFVPGKLFDYLRVGKPIFALSANPEVKELIESTQSGRCLHPEDTQGQTQLWKKIYREGAVRALGFDPRNTDVLSADTAAKQLAELLPE